VASKEGACREVQVVQSMVLQQCKPVREYDRRFREWNNSGPPLWATRRGGDPVQEIAQSLSAVAFASDLPPPHMKKTKKQAASKPKSRRKKTTAKQSATPSINPRHHPDAAGIDVGAEGFVAALPPERCEQTVRTFATYTSGVEALRDWLREHSITTVAMESTGNYWIML